MLASTTDSILDLFASIMNIVILRFALAPADEEHKFGHGKAESLAGLVQAAFVLGSAILLIFNGVERVMNPRLLCKAILLLGFYYCDYSYIIFSRFSALCY